MTHRSTLLEKHERIQDGQPVLSRITRPVPSGRLVMSFVLPLEVCKSQDINRHRKGWALSRDRSTILEKYLRPQWFDRRGQLGNHDVQLPLAGRPQVLCVRYSSVEPDALANWGKQVVDCLQPSRFRAGKVYLGLGIIRNDRPKDCEVVEWWEPASAKRGFCVFEVWTGEGRT
jgi:hypothetical protein